MSDERTSQASATTWQEAVQAQCVDPVVVLEADGDTRLDGLPSDAMHLPSREAIAEQLDPPRAGLAILTPEWLRQAAREAHLERDLAALRDLYAQAVLAVADADCPLSPPQWRSLGFLPHWHDEASDLTLQGFNLYDYKHRPDWLNAKYWANPELWGVYRW